MLVCFRTIYYAFLILYLFIIYMFIFVFGCGSSLLAHVPAGRHGLPSALCLGNLSWTLKGKGEVEENWSRLEFSKGREM